MQAVTHAVNLKIGAQLEEMAELHAGDKHRKQAYSRAAASIKKHHAPISSGAQARAEIKGIGQSIETKIDEILRSGSINELQNQTSPEKEKRTIIKQFRKIHGVGSVQAENWYNQGYRSMNDILPLYNAGRLTAAQQLGFYYYNDLQLKVPRAEIEGYETMLKTVYEPLKIEFTISGSYRRQLAESGDIDVLVRCDNILQVIPPLSRSGLIVGNLTPEASVKSMLIVQFAGRPARRMDVRLIHPASWPYALLYFTGSKNFNIVIRNWALSRGWSLSEYGFKDPAGQLRPTDGITTEEDIFKFLDLEYQPPVERTDAVQIKPLNKHLVTLTINSGWQAYHTTFIYAAPTLDLKAPTIKKIAAFDLDDTLIKRHDVNLMTNRLAVLTSLIQQGYVIVIFSNQKSTNDSKKANVFERLTDCVKSINLPILLIAALADDAYRKPNIGMWHLAASVFGQIDWTQTFFCGDAAGRPTDFAASDSQFAANQNVRFFTPELIFGSH